MNMFEDCGVLWQIMMFILPNLYGAIIFFATVLAIIVLSILQHVLFFPNPNRSVRSGGLLLLKNGLVILGGQYLGLLISMILGFFTSSLPYLSVVASEFAMNSPQDLVINRLYATLPIVFGMALVFLGSYFITLRKSAMNRWKKVFFSVCCSVVCGGCIYLGYLLLHATI